MRARYRSARGKRNLSSRLQLVLALLLAGLALTAVTRRYRSKPVETTEAEGEPKKYWDPNVALGLRAQAGAVARDAGGLHLLQHGS